ncbi:MAG TPA: ABC transporter permease [Anaerolineae bacterium]|nr:ABC transporter permease [Anaerolineae bacterium]
MAAAPKAGAAEKKKGGSSALVRLLRYSLVRLVLLFVTVVVGVYLTILIANMGGHVDKIQRGQIRESVDQAFAMNPQFKALPEAQKLKMREEQYAIQEKRLGLDKPFLVRSVIYLKNAITLDLGRALQMSSDSGSKMVKNILLERMPATLVLFGTADLLLFTLGVLLALSVSRKYGSTIDKIVVMMAPTSSAPGWFYGIFLILIFAALLGWLPFGHMVDAPPPDNKGLYLLSMLKHMILPVAALTMTLLPIQIYSWRTFFLIYSSEDYVEMAKAKGLKDKDIERRYILRPTLPVIITSFSLLVIAIWVGAPIFETIFQWPGFGRALYQAIGLYDTPVIVGECVIYAYLLAITLFLLDFVYALVDPRVKVGGGQGRAG